MNSQVPPWSPLGLGRNPGLNEDLSLALNRPPDCTGSEDRHSGLSESLNPALNCPLNRGRNGPLSPTLSMGPNLGLNSTPNGPLGPGLSLTRYGPMTGPRNPPDTHAPMHLTPEQKTRDSCDATG